MRFYQPGQFEYDAINDQLPTVSYILPTSYQSEHPDFMPAAGADYVASKVNAIAANPDVWAKTVFILIYDENDGFFDHVVPPTAPAGTAGEYITASASTESAPGPSAWASACPASSSRRGRSAATSATTCSTTPRSPGCSSW